MVKVMVVVVLSFVIGAGGLCLYHRQRINADIARYSVVQRKIPFHAVILPKAVEALKDFGVWDRPRLVVSWGSVLGDQSSHLSILWLSNWNVSKDIQLELLDAQRNVIAKRTITHRDVALSRPGVNTEIAKEYHMVFSIGGVTGHHVRVHFGDEAWQETPLLKE